MTIGGTGLGDNQRTWIGIVFSGLLAVNGSLAGAAAANAVSVPPYVYMGLAVAAMIIYAIKDQLGVRDSTSSRIAKSVESTSTNTRDASDSVTPPTT